MKVVKNYIYNASYQLLAIILPLITAPYISRVLKPYGVGIYSYTNSIIQWFTILSILGIDLYGQKQIAAVRDDKKKLSITFWEIQIIKTISTLISVVLLSAFLLIYKHYVFYIWLQAFNILATLLDISWLYMGLENFKITVIRNTLIKIASLILIFAFVRSEKDIAVYIIITGGAVAAGNLTLWPYLGNILEKVKFTELKFALNHLIPAIKYFIPQNAMQIYLIINKNMLGFFDNTTAAGFYNNADNIVRVVLVFVTSIGTVMMPHIANEFSKGNTEGIKQYTYVSFEFVSALSFVMAFGLAGIGFTGATLFYGKGYEPVGIAMPIESIIIIFLGWSNTLGTQYLVPTNRVNKYTNSIILGTFINLILDYPFIKIWGLYGAVVATVISEIVITVYQLNAVKEELDFKNLFKNNIKYFIAGAIMFTIVIFLNLNMKPTILHLLFQIFIGAIIYIGLLFLLRTNIVYFIKYIKLKK